MKKRILALLLSLVMVLGMFPTFAMAEESAATPVHEALVAANVTIDGSLTEADWRLANGKLSGGQEFDILWDEDNLYFAATADESDTELVVTVGGETLTTVEKTGNAFEAAVAYSTKGITTIEDVTLTVGDSVWTGDVNLVQMVRKDALSYSNMTNSTTNNSISVSATENGRGIVFDMPAAETAVGAMSTLNVFKTPLSALAERTGPVAMEFTFDPEAMPALDTDAPIGKVYAVRSGFEVVMSDGAGNAVRFAIGYYEGELFLNSAINSTRIAKVNLGKDLNDGAFEMKIVWNLNGSLDVYVDGVLLQNVPNATATDAQMEGSGFAANNLLYLRATRYDYNVALGLYDQPQKFTISDLRLSSACEVEYAEEPVVATGSVDAFVAADITLDGSLTEPAWRLTNELGGGQDFDILWDGTNLYFAVEAEATDTELVVTVGDETLLTAEKTGDAFEAAVAYSTKGVTTIEDVTLTVGSSVWTGDVNLVQMVRKDALSYSNMTNSTNNNSISVSATENGRGIVFDMPAAETAVGAMSTLNVFKTPLSALAERTGPVAMEFTFDPEAMPALDTDAPIGKVYAVRSGFEVVMSDGAGNAIRFAIGCYEGQLFLNSAINSTRIAKVNLGKDLDDGAFEIKLVWNLNGSLDVYVDGVLIQNVPNATATDAQMDGSGFAANNLLYLRATRYDYNVALGLYDQPQKFTISDLRLSSACEWNTPKSP